MAHSHLQHLLSPERTFDGPEDPTVLKSPRNGLYAHRAQADRISPKRPGVEPPATPPPAGFFPPLLREGLRRKELAGVSREGDGSKRPVSLYPSKPP
jgi:hypothetical protein